MIICILAGGEGSRLWPLSTPSKPKQILKLNNDNSLIQNTYTLMRKITENIFIVSEKSHSATMLKQLKNFNKQRMIIEPCRKGTTNCILLALRHIKKFYKGKKNDEKILFIHADHIFDDEKRFISSIKNAFDIKEDSIVVGGKKPVCAGTKYGYIKTKKISSSVYKVLQFKEKPDQKTANILWKKKNYFWNEGFLIGTINNISSSFKQFNPEVYQSLISLFALPDAKIEKFYSNLKSSAIEKSLMEKSNKILLSPITFGWVDLGTYNSLCSILEKDEKNIVKGNNIYQLENTGTFIYNKTNLKVGVIGLKNIAVVLTKDGLLVLNKEKENLVSEISKKMK